MLKIDKIVSEVRPRVNTLLSGSYINVFVEDEYYLHIYSDEVKFEHVISGQYVATLFIKCIVFDSFKMPIQLITFCMKCEVTRYFWDKEHWGLIDGTDYVYDVMENELLVRGWSD